MPRKAKPEDFGELANLLNIVQEKKISSDHRSEFSPGRSAGSAAPPPRTRPLRQGRTPDELKEQRAKSKLAEVTCEKGKVSGFGYLVFSPLAPGQMDARFPIHELPYLSLNQ